MNLSHRSLLHVSHRNPLATCVAACFALASPLAMAATTWTVNTCSEANSGSGTTGTLRYTVTKAASGDTIDMTGLTCSAITLTTGAIAIAQDSLTLNGPGIDKLNITGKYKGVPEADRIINHTGNGSLDIYNLSVSFGALYNKTGSVAGGCIYSAGTVTLKHVGIYFCEAKTDTGKYALGGGVYAKGGLTLKYSVMELNEAYGGTGLGAKGGGAMTPGDFLAAYSTISENGVEGASGTTTGFGGGLNLGGNVFILASTISANSSGHNVGGIDIFSSSPASLTATIVNSTVSGNSATNFMGGMYVNSGNVSIENSTIAFNTAADGRFGTAAPYSYYSPGVAFAAGDGPIAATLQSSLIANNTYGSGTNPREYDLSVANTSTHAITFSGSDNLVRATFASVPAGTIKISCPLLGPLRDNGGLTQTHALLSKSPGIGQGNNEANLTYDQRGSEAVNGVMNYPRISTGETVPDIGAYEIQRVDIIFNNGFDGCPLLE